MSRTVSIDEMADAINEGLKEYATANCQAKCNTDLRINSTGER